MNFRRILANAVARCVAALLVAAVLAWLGLGEARAQALPVGCTNSGLIAQCQDQPSALAAVKILPALVYGADNVLEVCGIEMLDGGGFVTSDPSLARAYRLRWVRKGYTATCPTGWGDAIAYWPADGSCSNRPSITSGFMPKSGSVSCNAGCEMAWFRNGDGTSTAYPLGTACTNADMPQTCTGDFYWNASLNVCEPNEPQCPSGQTVNSLGQCAPEPCPAGKVLGPDGTCRKRENECPAGQVRGPDGSCVDNECPAGQVRGPDGTCKRDDDGDGNEDDEEFFSGGDDCSTPPQCSGSPILCGQARIQWRIDCNTRKNRSISGGTCGAMPVCVGEKCDALEYSTLLQQWKAACALEKIAAGGGGTGGGNDGGAMDPVSSGGVLGDDLDPSSVRQGKGGSWDGEPERISFDEGGYGFGRSCPTPPTVTVMGHTLAFDTAVFCDWMRLGGVFVMIMAYLAGLSIVVRSS